MGAGASASDPNDIEQTDPLDKDKFIDWHLTKYRVDSSDPEKRLVLEDAYDKYWSRIADPDGPPNKRDMSNFLVTSYIRAFRDTISEDDFLKLHFDCFDKNGDGFVTPEEGLAEAIRSIGLVDPTNSVSISEWIKRLNPSARISFQEFQDKIKKLNKVKTFFSTMDLKAVFDIIDVNRDGVVEANEAGDGFRDRYGFDLRSLKENIREYCDRTIPEDAGFDADDIQTVLATILHEARYNIRGGTFPDFNSRLTTLLAKKEADQLEENVE